MQINLTGPQNSFVVVSVIAKKLTQVPLVIRMAQADAQAAMTAATPQDKKEARFRQPRLCPHRLRHLSDTPGRRLRQGEKQGLHHGVNRPSYIL